MNKKKATEETVRQFFKAVYPEMTALATTFGSEESILKDATEKIAALKAEVDRLREVLLKISLAVIFRGQEIADLKVEIDRLQEERDDTS